MKIPFRPRLAFLALPALVLLAGCQTAEAPAPTPAPREIPKYSIQDFLGTTNYRGSSFSPDGTKIAVSSDQTGIFNAYAIPVDGGEPVALTESTSESIYVLGYFPNDERLLYTADQGGNELNHLYVRELDGTTKDLTPGENLRAQPYGWSHDDRSLFFGTNERDQRFMDVYEFDVTSYERKLVYENEKGYIFSDISPDRRYLAFLQFNTNADSDVYLHDSETGETRHITPHEGAVNHIAQSFSPDSSSLYYVTDDGHEFAYLVRYDLASGEREVVEKPDWDVSFATFSRGGKYRIVGINNDSRTELLVTATATGEHVQLPELPDAEISSVGFSRDESTIAFYATSSRIPRDLFVYRLESEEAPRQLTRSLSEAIEPKDLVEAEVVRFESFDGVVVPGIFYKAHSASADNKAPALVFVHGGPGGQSGVGYSALIQYLVNHGYVVYAINNRGSSGYGKTFFHLDDRNHGQDDLDDCVASKKMLVETGYVDPGKIGIVGGSYGGYMVLAALTFRPEAFAAGVDLFGISNWLRTLQSIPAWWEAQRKYLEAEMGPFDNDEYFHSISPLFHAEKIVRPLMVLQGANDPRVLKAESDDIVAAVKANGVPVEYVVFDDEGHGFRKKENQERGYEAMLRFLDLHLKGEGAAPTETAPAGAAPADAAPAATEG